MFKGKYLIDWVCDNTTRYYYIYKIIIGLSSPVPLKGKGIAYE